MKYYWPYLLLFPLFINANIARAEGACPPGQYPIGGQGAAACAPIPQGSVAQPPASPAGKWTKTWGAIAMGSVDSTTIYGVPTGKLSKSEAEQDALMRCSSQGATDCKVVFTYNNQCTAIAEPHIDKLPFSGGIIKFAGAATTLEASDLALKQCKERNQQTPQAKCEVVYTACTEPVFQSY
jgi:hypothetical protein